MFDLDEGSKRFTVAVGGGCILIWPESPHSPKDECRPHEQGILQSGRTQTAASVGLIARFKSLVRRWL